MDQYSLSDQIESLDRATLTPIVQRATHCSGDLAHWQTTRLYVSAGGFSPSLIYRFSGSIQHAGQEQPWSLILKVTSAALPSIGVMANLTSDISREYFFYRSDLAKSFPPGFRAAHSYAQYQQVNPSGHPEYWIWLEDVGPYASKQWAPDQLYQVGLSLGGFNGAYLNGQPLPDAPWLKKDYVREYLRMTEASFQRLFAQREAPLIRKMFPPEVVDELYALWKDHTQHLDFLDRLPHTLCHGDAQFSNLFLVPTSPDRVETVAIDWGMMGISPLGYDLAQFLMLYLPYTTQAQAQVGEEALFRGYLDGIMAGGWQGDPRLVRLAFTSLMIKVRATHVLRRLEVISEDGQPTKWLPRHLQDRGMSLDEWIESGIWVQDYVSRLFKESLRLRSQLSFV